MKTLPMFHMKRPQGPLRGPRSDDLYRSLFLLREAVACFLRAFLRARPFFEDPEDPPAFARL